jgi:hypothetical protein
MNFVYVLRCAITGTPFAMQATLPEDFGMPVIWDESYECYWAKERVLS